MSKRDIVIKIMEEMEAWEEDTGVELSSADEYELGIRLYNMLVDKGYLESEE